MPTFQNRRQVVQNSVELAQQVPASVLRLKYLHLIEQNKKQQPPNFTVWCWNLVRNGCKVGKTYLDNGLGFVLSQALYNKLTMTKEDFSEDVSEVRNAVMDEDFILKGIERKSTKESVDEANRYIYSKLNGIITAIRLLGADTVLTAVKLKQCRFEALLEDVESYYNYYATHEPEILELLKAKTTPKKTMMYNDLIARQMLLKREMEVPEFTDFYAVHDESKEQITLLEKRIKELKQSFSQENKQEIKSLYAQITDLRRKVFEAKPVGFKELEIQMTNVKSEINRLLKGSVNDPFEKIQLFHLYNSISPQNYRKEIAKLNSAMSEGREALLNHLAGMIQSAIALTDVELQAFKDLKIAESYYFPKLFEATNTTKRNFKNLLNIASSGDGDLEKTFNALEQNKITQQIFEKEGLNYKVWSSYDPNRDCIRINENTVIKKVDMNDIKHSLFLGNQVSCCTSIGSGARSHIAPNYVKNKFVQALELVVNGEPVANTMCYIVDLGKENGLGLILDNIEALKPFDANPEVLDYFIMLAKKILKDIGAPDMGIYSGCRMDVPSDKIDSLLFRGVRVLGHSGNDEMNLDSISSMILCNEKLSLDSRYLATYFIL